MSAQNYSFRLFVFLLVYIVSNALATGQQKSDNESRSFYKQVEDRGLSGLELHYSIPAFTSSDVMYDNRQWQYINIQGMGKMREPGKPALPATRELIAVPFNTQAEINSFSEGFTDYKEYTLFPALQPATDTEGAPEPEFEIDSLLYQTDDFFPKELATIAQSFTIRGMQVVALQTHPVQYNPVRGIIRVHKGIKVSLTFQGKNASFEPLLSQSTPFYLSTLAGTLLNGASLPVAKSHNLQPKRADYLILTIDNFKAAADSIAQWRRQMGYSCLVISKPSWTANQVKDTVATRFHSWLPRPDYLLIVGDHNHVPAQMFASGSDNYPTDLYYVCFDGSADYFPDMAKGRISVSSPTEAMNVARKIINYERFPVQDSLFYKNGLHCAQFQDDDTSGYATRRFTHTSEEIRDYVLGKGYDIQRIYYTDAWVTPTNYNNGFYSNGEPLPPVLLRANGFLWNGGETQIAQSINAGKFYVLHRDHGYVGGGGWAHPYFTKTSMSQLSNGNKLPVVFSINCHTGEFSLSECFAERFIRLNTGGAAGVFAASFASYSGYNDALTVGMFDAIWNSPGLLPLFGSGGISNPSVSNHPPILAMGDVLNHGLLRMMQTWNGSTSANTYQLRLFHYFGDPAMRMFTANPQSLFANIPDTIVAGTSSISIAALSSSDVQATATYKEELLAADMLATGNSFLHFSAVNDTAFKLIITLSKNNCIPFIKEVTIVSGAPALNDLPCGAIHLPVKKFCDPVSGTYNGAGASAVNFPSCANTVLKDVWYSFTSPVNGKAEVEINAIGGKTGLNIYSGICSALVSIACDTISNASGRLVVPLTNLTPGDTVRIRIWQNQYASPNSFDVCVRNTDSAVYAGLPYQTGFESGLDAYWGILTSTTAGRIRIDSSCQAHSGLKSLVMDQSINGTYSRNEARLHLNLRDQQKVKLSFWWREYGDENNADDGVFFSQDAGQNFVKVADLRGSFEGWTHYLLDVDRLAYLNGITLTESFVIKFQQYDNWGFICSNPTGGDGFAFDDISVYLDTTMNQYATIPYYTGFENGFDKYWTLESSRQEGRIVATSINTPHTGNYHMTMDLSSGSVYIRNNADLRLNLTGLSNLVLSFRWKSIGDESQNEDGVYFSDDGGLSFVKVMTLSDTNTYWSQKNLNINALAAANNLMLSSDFVIRFSQYDNGSMTSDGMAFDEVEIYQSAFPIIDLSAISMSFSADTMKTQTKDVWLINPGTDTLKINGISLPSRYSSSFTTPAIVLAGDSANIPVSFSPDTVGPFSGFLRLSHNASIGLDSLWVTGLGMYRELIPDLLVVDFDTIAIQTADTIIFNVSNPGNGTVRLTTVTAPSGFTVISNQNVNVAPGQNRPVSIRFAPFMPNTYSGQIIISSDANNLAIPIKGVAVNPAGLNETDISSGYTITPNPFGDFLNIEPLEANPYTIKLYDVSGQLILNRHECFGVKLNLVHLSAGVYILEISGQDKTGRMKIMKR